MLLFLLVGKFSIKLETGTVRSLVLLTFSCGEPVWRTCRGHLACGALVSSARHHAHNISPTGWSIRRINCESVKTKCGSWADWVSVILGSRSPLLLFWKHDTGAESERVAGGRQDSGGRGSVLDCAERSRKVFFWWSKHRELWSSPTSNSLVSRLKNETSDSISASHSRIILWHWGLFGGRNTEIRWIHFEELGLCRRSKLFVSVWGGKWQEVPLKGLSFGKL